MQGAILHRPCESQIAESAGAPLLEPLRATRKEEMKELSVVDLVDGFHCFSKVKRVVRG